MFAAAPLAGEEPEFVRAKYFFRDEFLVCQPHVLLLFEWNDVASAAKRTGHFQMVLAISTAFSFEVFCKWLDDTEP